MELRKILLGRGEFKPAEDIVEIAKQSSTHADENFTSAEPVLIFQTSTQQTWFVATDVTLYCILDDLNKDTTTVQWAMPASELKNTAGEIKARDRNDRTGLLQIGKHKDWLYSKRLFAGGNIVNFLSDVVTKKMV